MLYGLIGVRAFEHIGSLFGSAILLIVVFRGLYRGELLIEASRGPDAWNS